VIIVLLLLVFGGWCVRPYYAKTEANIRRMASEQGARLGSRISKQLSNYRSNMLQDAQMQVSPRTTPSAPLSPSGPQLPATKRGRCRSRYTPTRVSYSDEKVASAHS
jgi:hypothetical protein